MQVCSDIFDDSTDWTGAVADSQYTVNAATGQYTLESHRRSLLSEAFSMPASAASRALLGGGGAGAAAASDVLVRVLSFQHSALGGCPACPSTPGMAVIRGSVKRWDARLRWMKPDRWI